jgi:hypothetical protein
VTLGWPSLRPCDLLAGLHVASGEAERNPQILPLGAFPLHQRQQMLLLKGHATFNSKQILRTAV